MILAEGLSRRYGRFQAVKDVSFRAGKGEVVGLLGQNGAGKSTVMNVLSGCLAPSEGRVEIMSYDMAAQPRQAKRHLGYLPEVPPLYPEMTVMEYLRFCCDIKGVLRADREKHIEEVLVLTGLEEMRDRLVSRLSRGFQQRTGLAQALCGAPEVLLLDEPTAGFDPLQAVSFRKLIRKLARDRVILFSSHLLGEVQAICDRVLILHEGRLLMDHTINSPARQVPQYRLVIDAPPARVLSPLRQLPSVRRLKQLSGHVAGETHLIAETEPCGDFQKELFTLLTGMSAPILELTPLEDTLETLFIKAIGNAGTKA